MSHSVSGSYSSGSYGSGSYGTGSYGSSSSSSSSSSYSSSRSSSSSSGSGTYGSDSYSSSRHSGGSSAPPAVDPNPPSHNTPVPPAVDPNPPSHHHNPVPPAVDPNPPYVPPVVDPNPPVVVHTPRYYYPDLLPPILPAGNPLPLRQVPQLSYPATIPYPEFHHPQIVPPSDVLQLLDHFGMLHKKDHHQILFAGWDTYPNISEADAKNAFDHGGSVWVDQGGKKVEFRDPNQLQGMLSELQARYSSEVQASYDKQDADTRASIDNQNAANRAAVDNQDISNRRAALPAFNNVYDTGRLLLNSDLMTSFNGNAVDRNVDSAVSFYQSDDMQNALAVWWHNHPNASTNEFNQAANNLMTDKFHNMLGFAGVWAAEDPSIMYLQGDPIPGLRYPETQEDINWNQDVISKVAINTPIALSSALYQPNY